MATRAPRAFEPGCFYVRVGVKQLDVRGNGSYLPPVFLYDVNGPVDGAGRSPNAPAPHTDTPLHGVTEPAVCRHTHLPFVPALLTGPHPPLLCRPAALPLSVPLSWRPLSSLPNLARVLLSLALSGCPALHGPPGVLITPGWSGRSTTGGSRTRQRRNPSRPGLESLRQLLGNVWSERLGSWWTPPGVFFCNNNNLSAPSPELR